MVDQQQKKFRLFFGSTVVLGCFIGMLGNVGQVVYASFGVLIGPFGEQFGWGRGDISLGISFMTAAIAFSLPTAGKLTDRYGTRIVVSLSVLLSGTVLLCFPLAISMFPSILVFYLLIIIVSIIGSSTNTVAYVRVISAWYDRRRGLFIGINASGVGLGFVLIPLLAQWSVNKGGWQAGYYGLGGFLILVVFPVIYKLIINKPQDIGMLPDGVEKGQDRTSAQEDSAASVGLQLREALNTRVFWLIIFIMTSAAFALNGILTQMVPLVTDRGGTPSVGASVAATMGLSMTIARIVVGYLIDKYFAPYVAICVFILVFLGIGLLLFGDGVAICFVAAFLMGLGIGAEADLLAFLVSRYFGLKHFGSIFGYVFMSYLLGTGLGPFVLGKSFDLTGNYDVALLICASLIGLVTILFTFLSPYDKYLSADTRRQAMAIRADSSQ